MLSIDVTPRPTFIPARVTSLLEATVGRWPRCLPMQHPAAARPRPAGTKPDPPGARTHRICDPAYLYGRARVDLKASEILFVPRHPMIRRVAHHGQSQPAPPQLHLGRRVLVPGDIISRRLRKDQSDSAAAIQLRRPWSGLHSARRAPPRHSGTHLLSLAAAQTVCSGCRSGIVQRETAGGPPQETGAIVRADPKHANPARSTIWPLATWFLLTPLIRPGGLGDLRSPV
jgi:hypothetical protein